MSNYEISQTVELFSCSWGEGGYGEHSSAFAGGAYNPWRQDDADDFSSGKTVDEIRQHQQHLVKGSAHYF